MDWIGLELIESKWIGLDWIESDWIGLSEFRPVPFRTVPVAQYSDFPGLESDSSYFPAGCLRTIHHLRTGSKSGFDEFH